MSDLTEPLARRVGASSFFSGCRRAGQDVRKVWHLLRPLHHGDDKADHSCFARDFP